MWWVAVLLLSVYIIITWLDGLGSRHRKQVLEERQRYLDELRERERNRSKKDL